MKLPMCLNRKSIIRDYHSKRFHNKFLHVVWDLMTTYKYTDEIMWWIERSVLDLIFMKRMGRVFSKILENIVFYELSGEE